MDINTYYALIAAIRILDTAETNVYKSEHVSPGFNTLENAKNYLKRQVEAVYSAIKGTDEATT